MLSLLVKFLQIFFLNNLFISFSITQLKIQEQLQDESRKQKKQRQEIFIVEDEIAEMRDKMIADIQQRMKQEITKEHLFTINWKLI